LSREELKLPKPIQDITRLAAERPYALMVLQYQVLYDLASMLESLLGGVEELKAAIVPSGEVLPLEVPVYQGVKEIRPGGEWRGVSVYNRGPSVCYMQLSKKMLGYKPVKVESGVSKSWMFPAPVIRSLYARSEDKSVLEIEFTR